MTNRHWNLQSHTKYWNASCMMAGGTVGVIGFVGNTAVLVLRTKKIGLRLVTSRNILQKARFKHLPVTPEC